MKKWILISLLLANSALAQPKLNSRGEPINLDPAATPAQNFDLSQWNLSIPTDANKDNKADNIPTAYLKKGFQLNPLFYTGEDGGMVFATAIQGAKTSSGTKFTRTELREMLRGTDTRIKTKGITKNNWVFSTAKRSVRRKAGAVDGTLEATLAVNHVTTSGDPKQVGRVIIGQIHATDDEPVRLYYRKLPNNTKGSIYIAHEPLDKDDLWFDMIGKRASNAPDPIDGIALGEVFSYKIEVKGSELTITIIRQGKADVVQSVDMTDSGYHKSNQYMYFKAGVYNQNNTGEPGDYVQATFYQLENSH